MIYEYKIVDRDNSELPRHHSGRLRTLEEVKELVDKLNKQAGYEPYSMVREDVLYKYAITDFSNDNVIIFHTKMDIKELKALIEKEEDNLRAAKECKENITKGITEIEQFLIMYNNRLCKMEGKL